MTTTTNKSIERKSIKGYCPQCGNPVYNGQVLENDLIGKFLLNCPKCGKWEIEPI